MKTETVFVLVQHSLVTNAVQTQVFSKREDAIQFVFERLNIPEENWKEYLIRDGKEVVGWRCQVDETEDLLLNREDIRIRKLWFGLHPAALARAEYFIETNRRLNRRCQEAERRLNDMEKKLAGTTNVFQAESKRMCRYAGELRDLAKHQKEFRFPPWNKCWMCKLRTWLRWKIWNRYFAMKEK